MHPVETLIVSTSGILLYANRPALETLDLGAHLIGQQVFDAFAEPSAKVRDRLRRCASSGTWQPITLTVGPSLDTGMKISLRARGLRDAQSNEVRLMIVADMMRRHMFDEHRRLVRRINSQLAEAHERQRQLDRSLTEQFRLHQELIHRVKNNLALLTGLIRARKVAASHPEAKDALQDIFNRVMAIGLVHTLLDREDRIDEIDIGSLLEALCQQVENSVCPAGVEIRRNLQSSTLTVSQATPVALLVNEMLTNALKHAFVHRQSGVVEVSATVRDDGSIVVDVADDGIGMPADPAGHGSRIMMALADQLAGSLERVGESGTHWRLHFRPRDTDGQFRLQSVAVG